MLEVHQTITLQGDPPSTIRIPVPDKYQSKEHYVSRLILTLISPDRRTLDLAFTGREIVIKVPLTSDCFSEVPLSIMEDTEVTGSNNHGETFICFDEEGKDFYLNAEWYASFCSSRCTCNSHMPLAIEVRIGSRLRSLLGGDPSLYLVADVGADIEEG